jgi:hypothetical protein
MAAETSATLIVDSRARWYPRDFLSHWRPTLSLFKGRRMISARVTASLLLAAAAGHCSAQEFVRHSLSFLEVVAGTNNPVPVPNGRIDPGEGARISLTITVSPAVGTTITYTPPPAPGTGTVAGFGSTVYRLDILGGAAGAWSFITRQSAWALGGQGDPQPTAGVHNIQADSSCCPA